MKTITLSLTDAFRLRNLLKTAISKNRNILLSTSLFYNPETQMKEHNTFVTKYESLPKLLDLVLEEQSTLGNLNTAIDKANVDIGPSVFSNCTSLTSVTIPDSVKKIEDNAFSNCTSLTNVTIPNSVERIEYNAFSNCTSLTSVTIPNSVERIEDNAFSNCTSLTSVTIPNSVKKIEYNAFSNCTSLSEESKKSIRDHGYEGDF